MNDRFAEHLQAYLDGELSREGREEIERRLHGDAALREELETLSAAREALLRLDRKTAPTGIPERVIARVRTGAHGPSSLRVSGLQRVAASVALVLLPAAGFLAGHWVGSTSMITNPQPSESSAPPAGISSYLFLLHGTGQLPPNVPEEQRSWRQQQFTTWANSLRDDGKLVVADDLSDDGGRGVWANGAEDPAEAWFTSSWAVPSRFYIIRAWSYEEALRVARSSPHLEYGGSITVRLIDQPVPASAGASAR